MIIINLQLELGLRALAIWHWREFVVAFFFFFFVVGRVCAVWWMCVRTTGLSNHRPSSETDDRPDLAMDKIVRTYPPNFFFVL